MLHRILTASLRLIGAVYAVAAFAAAASANDNTRYISITGNNANPCTLAQPCRTLQRAIQRTPGGGEIRILDSGFYGSNATINKSLTITGNGHTVYLGAELTINRANAVVALRGLHLKGGAIDASGVNIVAAAAVHIERCIIEGFRGPTFVMGSGIAVDGVNTNLFVIDTISRDNERQGLYFDPATTGGGRLVVDNSRFENNGGSGVNTGDGESDVTRTVASGNASVGIQVLNGGRMNITSTTAAHNGVNGFRSVGGDITLESSVARGNGAAGVYNHNFSGGIRLSSTVMTGNATGLENGGNVYTRENNVVHGNGTDLVGNAPIPLAGF